MVRDRKWLRADDLGPPGGARVWHLVSGHGGIGRNVCENLGRLGAEPAFVGLTEPGAAGEEFERRLVDCGTRLFVRPATGGIGRFDCEIDRAGELAGFTIRLPASGELGWDVVATATDWLRTAGMVVVETGLPEPMLHRLRSWTRSHGVPLCGLPTRVRDFGPRWTVLTGLDLLVLNRDEAAALLDRPGVDPAEAAVRLTARGIGTVVVTSGAAGAVSAERGGPPRAYPVETVECADTTGAGDAFVAGLAAGLGGGLPLPAAIRLGLRASEVTVRCLWSTCSLVSGLAPAGVRCP
ncbi:pseudouridine kinase [Saccharothrix australiensis]|uniref:Pseudouridine kinase n=2 Tax=Saccharothrix australiensis TaxID=2072 RepID=A0A495VYK5_9PSEU|nr:pseudouridine kinase [Saccharothrix australiensis]